MQLISAFVYAIRIVQSLYFLNPKFQVSSHLLCLHSPVCVRPGRKSRRPVFSKRGSFVASSFSEIAARIVYQIAHEYRIPPVLEKAEAALLRIIRSGVGKWEPYYSVSQMLQYNGTFLKNLFELLEFSLTYNNGTLLDAVAERISVFPMEVFIEHSSYKDLPESTKNKILMCRLRRCDKNKVFK